RPEAEMGKCEVIFARALSEVSFEPDPYNKVAQSDKRIMNNTPRTLPLLPILILVFALSLCFFGDISPAFAQEIHVAGGFINRNTDGDRSSSWLISYFDEITDHFAWSFSWLNEGHLEDHHRDGPSVQLWIRKYLLDRRLSLGVGAGPYFAFDTDRERMVGNNYENRHQLGGLFSLAATWHTKTRWLFQTRLENVWLDGEMDTTSLLLGVGYRFPPPGSAEAKKADTPAYQVPKNEITLFLGYTNVNGPTDNDFAASVEYRRDLARYLGWTVGWIQEIDTHEIDRKGVATQLWGRQRFFDDQLGMGAGFGVYFFKDDAHDPQSGIDDDLRAAGLITLTASYQLPRQFVLRASWSRVITDYDRDSDVFLCGLGYRF
ncbi:MAG: hypothetical protein ACLFUL_13050, partial [Desulfobacteraceae bacterium]